MTCKLCKDKVIKKEIPKILKTFQANKSISANYSLFEQSRSSRSTRYSPKLKLVQPITRYDKPKSIVLQPVSKKTETRKPERRKPERRKTKYSPIIQVKPVVIPVNTIPVVESIIIEKDCGWFGEKCFFDDISKGVDEAGKNMDNFVKEEIRKQDESWEWFNNGIQETQNGIAEFFEDEGKKQQETIKDIQNTIDSGVEWIQDGIEEKQNEIDSSIKWIQDGIEEKFEEFEKGVNWVQEGIDESIRSVGDGIVDIIDIPKQVDQFGKDVQKNILIIGAIGLGAVVIMSRIN